MNLEDLIFVGLNGWALALHRDTGQIVWSNDKMKGGYVTILLDGDRLIVSTNGYLYCLDPLDGRILWENPLKGYRTGVTALASVRGQASPNLAQQSAADDARRSASSGGPPH